MKKIYWTIPNALGTPELEILYFEPEPAYKFLLDKNGTAEYLKCPALPAYLKNTFILRAPMDINLWVDENGEFHTDSCSQKFYDDNFWCRKGQSGKHLVQLPPSILFFTEDGETVIAESLPPVLHEVPNALFIPGSFDISKWVRALNFGFEIADVLKPIVVKRGDPLYMVKFICKDDDSVQLERALMNEHIKSMTLACAQLKHITPKINLKTMYGMASNYLKLARARIFK